MGRLIFSLFLLFSAGTGFVVAEPQLAPSQGPSPTGRISEGNPPKNLTGGDKQEPTNQSQKANPLPDNSPAGQQSANDGAKKPESQPSYDWRSPEAWLDYLTGGLILVGTFQIALFLWQLWLIRESLTDAKIAADAAKEGADAARQSTEISRTSMVSGDRAYVHFLGMRWVSHYSITEKAIFWRIRPQWINSGNTPTRRLHVYVKYYFESDPLPDTYLFEPERDLVKRPATIAPKTVVESAPIDVFGRDLVAVSEGKKHFYAWGIATYRDVFPGTPERITRFCVYIDSITGDVLAQWHKDSNNVELRFPTYTRHNCADEDCE